MIFFRGTIAFDGFSMVEKDWLERPQWRPALRKGHRTHLEDSLNTINNIQGADFSSPSKAILTAFYFSKSQLNDRPECILKFCVRFYVKTCGRVDHVYEGWVRGSDEVQQQEQI